MLAGNRRGRWRESISWGDVRKDWQQMVGSKANAKEIGGTLKTKGESLSKTPRMAPTQSAKQPTNQTNKTGKKNSGAEAREEGDRRIETQGKRIEERKG
jgi:hypothetical protein